MYCIQLMLYLQSCLNNNFMIEQFNFDIRLIHRKSPTNPKNSQIREKGFENPQKRRSPFFYGKTGVTQQELCNATFKDKPSMTRLIDNMERQHLVVRISDKKRPPHQLDTPHQRWQGAGRTRPHHCQSNAKKKHCKASPLKS